LEDLTVRLLPQSSDIGSFVEESPGRILLAGLTFVFSATVAGGNVSISSLIEWQQPFPARLAKDSQGVVWLGRADGLWRLEGNAFAPAGIDDTKTLKDVSSLASCREGGVWAGTGHDGLFLISPRKIQTLTMREGLIWDDAWSVVESRDRSVWIATRAGVTHVTGSRCENFGTGSGLPTPRAVSVVEDRDGRIWVGSETDGAPGGVSFLENGRFVTLGANEQFTDADVSSLAPDPGGGVWISGVAGVRLWRNGRLSPATRLYGQGILFVDRDKDLWSGGEMLWRSKGGRWTGIPKMKSNGLEPGLHAVVKQNEAGAYWLVSGRQGVVRFKNGRFKAITTKNGLFNDLTLSLVEDDEGRYWFNSHTGLFWAWKKDLNEVADGKRPLLTCVHYGIEDGMLNVEGNGGNWPNSCKTRDGRLWFPTVKGVAIVDSRQVAGDDAPPSVIVEEARADGDVLFSNAPNFAQANSVAEASKAAAGKTGRKPGAAIVAGIRVPPRRRHTVHIDYTTTSMIAPEKLCFRYCLEGRAPEWTEAGNQRFAVFDGLSPGRYRFLVTVGNARGVWNDRPVEFRFSIEPEFYQTWTFYSVCGVALVGVLGGLGDYRRKMTSRIARLEKETALAVERERMARDLHDDLGGSLTHIALRLDIMRSRVGQSVEADQEMEKLSFFARAAIENIGQIIWATNPRFDSLASLTSYIREYASKHLADESRFVCDIGVAEGTGLHLNPEFRRHVFYTVKEALTNIAKHARAKNVALRIAEERGVLRIEIADDGIGFAPDSGLSTRTGLDSMRKRVAALGGQIEIDSKPGAGTTIRLAVPIR